MEQGRVAGTGQSGWNRAEWWNRAERVEQGRVGGTGQSGWNRAEWLEQGGALYSSILYACGKLLTRHVNVIPVLFLYRKAGRAFNAKVLNSP